ncbi:glycosyltransferase family 2 protein [uncultured Aeromicrobium sp.]|uniref:glycosyltransferase family 2 protein n=1 Tax=uncultured Aeromicrobium sp. TaxID=337820 RepID=UPI0025CEBD2D|nr:glycosyltransferase family 2 protein [uncultured Aeromicrobium sp.]
MIELPQHLRAALLAWANEETGSRPSVEGWRDAPVGIREALSHGLAANDRDAVLLVAAEVDELVELASRGRLPQAAERWRTRADAAPLNLLADHLLDRFDALPATLPQERAARGRRDAEVAAWTLAGRRPPEPVIDAEVSVVVTAHNVGPWIRETLFSIFSQDDVRLEVVVVDDHSEDETPDILDEAAKLHPNLRVVRPCLRGGAHARNVGAAFASAPYLAFCDGDDLVPDGSYRALLDASLLHEAPLAVGNFLKFRPAHTWKPSRAWEAYAHDAAFPSISDAPSIMYHRACWNKIFRRSWWNSEDIVFPEVPRSNDIVPMTQAYVSAAPIAMTTKIVYLYRERPGLSSMTSAVGTRRSLASYLHQELLCADLVESVGSSDLWMVYSRLFLRNDGWVQVGRYLRGLPADELPDPAIVGLVGDLARRFDAEHFRQVPLPARIMFAAFARADVALAREAASIDARESTPAERLRACEAMIRLWPGGSDERIPDIDVVVDIAMAAIDDLVADTVSDSHEAAETLHAIATALRTNDRWQARLQSKDLELGGLLTLAAVGTEAATDQLAAMRDAVVTITRIERSQHRHGMTLYGSIDSEFFRLDVLKFVKEDAVGVGVPQMIATDQWRLQLADTALRPAGRRRVVAVGEHLPTGQRVQVHVRHQLTAPVPTPTRRDRLYIIPDIGPANVAVIRRRWWPLRAIGKLLRAARSALLR